MTKKSAPRTYPIRGSTAIIAVRGLSTSCSKRCIDVLLSCSRSRECRISVARCLRVVVANCERAIVNFTDPKEGEVLEHCKSFSKKFFEDFYHSKEWAKC